MKSKNLNWFEERTLQCLIPYKYDDKLNVTENGKRDYVYSMASIFDLIIIPIGLYFLNKRRIKKR